MSRKGRLRECGVCGVWFTKGPHKCAEPREWDIHEQARIAQANFNARPDWVKRISHFAGTNNAEPDVPSQRVLPDE